MLLRMPPLPTFPQNVHRNPVVKLALNPPDMVTGRKKAAVPISEPDDNLSFRRVKVTFLFGDLPPSSNILEP